MAAPVDICNLALSYIGDDAQVASITPPDQTNQAVLCARFYPIARDAVLDAHAWGFASKRIALAQINSTLPATSAWQYAYAMPTDCLTALAIQDSASSADFSTPAMPTPPAYGVGAGYVALQQGAYTPQEFIIEADVTTGAEIIYTNQPNAMLRYVSVVTDTERFPPGVVQAVAWTLASMLAGPIVKGAEGRAAALDARRMAESHVRAAAAGDSVERVVRPTQSVTWMANR